MISRYFIRQNLKLQLCSTRNYVPDYNKRKTDWILRKAKFVKKIILFFYLKTFLFSVDF